MLNHAAEFDHTKNIQDNVNLCTLGTIITFNNSVLSAFNVFHRLYLLLINNHSPITY